MDAELIAKNASSLERVCWLIVFFSMLSQLSGYVSFPSYNIALGFWGTYCSFSKQGRATFGFLVISFLSVLIDIVFCSITSADSPLFTFCLVVYILCMFLKVWAIMCASKFFGSLGGAYSMENQMNPGTFDSLVPDGSARAYRAPDEFPANNGLSDSGVYE